MTERVSYEYSKARIGAPSVLLAAGWIALWLLWPSFDPDAHRIPARREGGTTVSYGVGSESLYMSPLLFARSTRVGFRAPEESALDVELGGEEEDSERLRFLHVNVSPPDWDALKIPDAHIALRKRVDGYRPLWEHGARFGGGVSTNRVVVEVRGALRECGYHPGEIAINGRLGDRRSVACEGFVELDADGKAQRAFLEEPTGISALDTDIVRALEVGEGRACGRPVSGRVRVTIRRADESED